MKQQINIRLGLVSLIAIVTTVISITLIYYNLFQQQVRNDLKETTLLLAETKVFQNPGLSGKKTNGTFEAFKSGKFRITWINEEGTVLFDNDAEITNMANHLDRPEIQTAFKYGCGESTRHSDTMNMDTFYYALLLDNHTILRLSTQARTISSLLVTALPVIILIVIIILLGCILIGHLLTRQLMKPLEKMAENLDSSSGSPVYKELEPFMNTIRSQHEDILAAVKSRQDFTANISHELKTPISAISGYAELIETRMVDVETSIYIAGQIRHNAARLLSLVTDIIQLSELDHRELPRSFETMDLLAAARECVKDLKPMADQKSISLTCSGIPAAINAEPRLIRELIDNLVQNGIRYNREKGAVDVSVSILDSHPILSVKDTGIGIPADQQDRIFERFYRVDKSRSRETGGTGLGLAIVKHIAQIHSAEISLHSVPGKGTQVKVRF